MVKKAYTASDLIRVLGVPDEKGDVIGDGSGGFGETPWSPAIPRVPLGQSHFMLWRCTNGGMCAAQTTETTDEWYMVRTCEKHTSQLLVTPFEDLFPMPSSNVQPPERDLDMLIVDAMEYRTEKGHDWKKVQDLLNNGWTIALVHDDRRFPNHTFLVMKR